MYIAMSRPRGIYPGAFLLNQTSTTSVEPSPNFTRPFLIIWIYTLFGLLDRSSAPSYNRDFGGKVIEPDIGSRGLPMQNVTE